MPLWWNKFYSPLNLLTDYDEERNFQVGCADYRIYSDGDSDGDGNDLMLGVLDNEETEVTDFRFSILIFGEQINDLSPWSSKK